MKGGPWLRTIYQFICPVCGKEEFIRYPINPMIETPALEQSIPPGWEVIFRGDYIQTPEPRCPDCKAMP